MTVERWGRIQNIFLEALDCPTGERGFFLDRACDGDQDLRREVESLLACDLPEKPLAEITREIGLDLLEQGGPDFTGRRAGPYRLTRLIGHGGMGAVYLGVRDDDQYQKQVAIKLLKRGMDTDFMLSRFRQERQILANLEHPFIARMLDGGATEDGLPYFVMEYVDGVPITTYCREKGLSIPERLRLFRLVCEAVQCAHQNLVVHRDIKPSNILTTKEGIPKLLDFGIAKVIDPHTPGATLTMREYRMLTPDYASPEQVKGIPIGTASDTYSLGVVLYEMLTGQMAHRFGSESIADLERTICEIEPEKPSVVASRSLARQLRGDLDNIVLTAMRKEPQRRYASAAEFGEDLRRHLEGLPVLAQEDRWSYRTGKFIRRNRVMVAAGALLLASLVGGIVATTIQARRAARRFQEVRTLANSFLFDIHDQIEALPGSTKVRQSIVSTVLRYLNNLAREAKDDPTLQWELATAYQKIGDVQGYGVRPNLGQFEAALESQNKALQMAEQLAARGYDPKIQRLLAVAHHRVGFLLVGFQTKSEIGLEHYRQAAALLKRLLRESPGNPEDSPLLATVYGHLGDAQMLRARPGEAAAAWEQILGVAEQWATRYPSEAAQLALGSAHRRLSRAAQLNGDLKAAMEHARKAVAIHEPIAAAQPANTARQRDLLNSLERLSFVAGEPESWNLGDLPTAAAYNRRVLAIAQALRDADPHNRMAQTDLVLAKLSACAFVPGKDAALLVQVCQEAVKSAEPGGQAMSLVQPGAALRLGPALMRLGRRAEAVTTMRQAIQTIEADLVDWPWRDDIRMSLLRVHNQFGAMLLGLGDATQSLDHHRTALAIAEKLLPEHPDELAIRRDLADTYTALGRYWEKVDRAQAAGWYKKDLEIWNKWPVRGNAAGPEQERRAQALRNLARCEGQPGR